MEIWETASKKQWVGENTVKSTKLLEGEERGRETNWWRSLRCGGLREVRQEAGRRNGGGRRRTGGEQARESTKRQRQKKRGMEGRMKEEAKVLEELREGRKMQGGKRKQKKTR